MSALARVTSTLALLVSASANAQENVDYRAVTLVDGRVVVGEVINTEPAGIRVRAPQGEVIVPFHLLQDVKASSASAASSQRPWEVVVAGPEAERRWIEQVFRTYPAVKVAGDGGYPNPLPLASLTTARACPPVDLQCAVTASARSGAWSWIILVEPVGAGATLRAKTSLGTAGAQAKVANLKDPREITAALDKLLALAAVPEREAAVATLTGVVAATKPTKPPKPGDGPAARPTKPAPKPEASKPLSVDVLVPLPGYPALKAGDYQGFGLSLAAGIPTAAAWVGVTGAESRALPEHLALSAGGWWLTSIVVNQVSSSKVSVALGPGGGRASAPGERSVQLLVTGQL